MNPDRRPIFRPDAIRRYTQSRNEPVLPRFGRGVSPLLLWSLAVVFAACGLAVVLRAKLPVYVSGPAARVPHEAAGDRNLLVVFLPPEQRGRLRAGQRVSLRAEGQAQPFGGSLVAVEPAVARTQAVLERYGLGSCAAPDAGEAAVALAEAEVPPGARAEGPYRADVEIGARRLGARLPLVGRLFGD
jgi:hypothetical protein